MFQYVNRTGGWTTVGRVKPGMIADQAANPAPGAYNPHPVVMVPSGSLIRRLAKLPPMIPQILNLVTMDAFKIDLVEHVNNHE